MPNQKIHWREYEVDKNQFGELTFFDDAAVQIGNRVYAPGALIHDVLFANGHCARRRLDQPRLLEVIAPDGEHYYFRYAYLARVWYRRIPQANRTYSVLQQRTQSLGPLAGPVCWAAVESAKWATPLLFWLLLAMLPTILALVAAVLVCACS